MFFRLYEFSFFDDLGIAIGVWDVRRDAMYDRYP